MIRLIVNRLADRLCDFSEVFSRLSTITFEARVVNVYLPPGADHTGSQSALIVVVGMAGFLLGDNSPGFIDILKMKYHILRIPVRCMIKHECRCFVSNQSLPEGISAWLS